MSFEKIQSILKYVAIVFLPAFSTFYVAMSKVWNLPYSEQISGTIAAIVLFMGMVLQIGNSLVNREHTATAANRAACGASLNLLAGSRLRTAGPVVLSTTPWCRAGKKPLDTIEVFYGTQELWPDHCVQGTPGAQFRDDLQIPHAELVLRKGYHRDIDSYSAFYENDRTTRTGLAGHLRERGFTRVFIAGLAFDFCVRYSAEDAQREGFDVVVIEDACRGIDVQGSIADTHRLFDRLGIQRVLAATIERGV